VFPLERFLCGEEKRYFYDKKCWFESSPWKQGGAVEGGAPTILFLLVPTKTNI